MVWGDWTGSWKSKGSPSAISSRSPIFSGQTPSICEKRESTRPLHCMALPLAVSLSFPCFLKQTNKNDSRAFLPLSGPEMVLCMLLKLSFLLSGEVIPPSFKCLYEDEREKGM